MGIFKKKYKETREITGDFYEWITSLGMTEELAMAVPAFSACVNFVSNAVASLPLRLCKRAEKGMTDVLFDDYRIKLLNYESGDLLNAFQLKKALVYDYLLQGNGYLYINRLGNKIESLHYVDARKVEVMTNIGVEPIVKRAKIYVNGKYYNDWDFVCATRQTKDGITGKSLITEHRELLTTAYNTLLFEKRMVKSNGNKRGFLQTEHKVDGTVVEKIKEAWKKLYSSEENIVVLNEGIRFQEAGATSVELQLNETKKSNNDTICQIMGVPPVVLAGGGSDDDYQHAIQIAVVPVLASIQSAFNRALLLEEEKGDLFFEFDYNELTKGNLIQRAQANKIALSAGYVTVDEVRVQENLQPLNLDFVRLGLNEVFYDPKSKLIYTPNTNAVVKMGSGSSEGGESKFENRNKK